MRMFGLIGLVLALVVVGLLAKQQLSRTAIAKQPAAPGVSAPAAVDAHTQAQQVQQQVKDALNAAAQARKMPDDN